jgi:hypothetical protein
MFIEIFSIHFWHVYGGTCIAINKSEGKVLLASADKVKIYDFDKIKEWEYKIHSGGYTMSGGLLGKKHYFA